MSIIAPGTKFLVIKWKQSMKHLHWPRYEVYTMDVLSDPEPDYWTVVAKDLDSEEAHRLCKDLESRE